MMQSFGTYRYCFPRSVISLAGKRRYLSGRNPWHGRARRSHPGSRKSRRKAGGTRPRQGSPGAARRRLCRFMTASSRYGDFRDAWSCCGNRTSRLDGRYWIWAFRPAVRTPGGFLRARRRSICGWTAAAAPRRDVVNEHAASGRSSDIWGGTMGRPDRTVHRPGAGGCPSKPPVNLPTSPQSNPGRARRTGPGNIPGAAHRGQQELRGLEEAVESIGSPKSGARLCVISFHSWRTGRSDGDAAHGKPMHLPRSRRSAYTAKTIGRPLRGPVEPRPEEAESGGPAARGCAWLKILNVL